MSTDVISRTLDTFRQDLIDYVNEECVEVTDYMTAEEFAGQVIGIAKQIAVNDSKTTDAEISSGEESWQVRVINVRGGLVSVSCDDCTGVSNTLWYPFYNGTEGWFSGLVSLASMINEALYYCES